MPLIVIPASISNNVPGTDFSIGADTAVNEVTEICDRLRQSAKGKKRQVFVIETMGGYCGYLATLAGLAAGADAAHIYEVPLTDEDVKADVEHMNAKLKGVSRGLTLRNEKCNFSTDSITRLYRERSKNVFTTTSNILGDTLQGGRPSPFDRNLATKMAATAADWICQQLEAQQKATSGVFQYTFTDQNTAVLLGLKGNAYQHTPLQALTAGTDFE